MKQLNEIIESLKSAHKLGLEPAFTYDRISDDIQSDGLSLEFQAEGASKYATENGLHVIHKFTVIESASREGRKVFNQMIDLALNFGVRHLIFKNTDRMSRNYQDLVRIEKLLDQNDFKVHFYQTSLKIDKYSNYNDRFLIGIQLAVAKHLSDKISQDVREHNLFKARHGTAPGNSPFGYSYDKSNKVHIIDREAEKTCRYLFETFDNSSMSLDQLVECLNDRGMKSAKGKKWTKGPLHYLLTNPFYHGEFLYQGKIWPGKHEPYYNRERYLGRLQRLGDRYVGQKRRDYEFALAGLLRCSCGRTMSGEKKKGKYIYYKHACSDAGRQIYLKEAEISALLNARIEQGGFSPSFAENLKKLFRRFLATRQQNGEAELTEIIARIRSIETKKDRLLDLFADDQINRETLRNKISALDRETERLEQYRNSFQQNQNELRDVICDLIDELRDQPAAFLSAPTQDQKAAILRNMAHRAIWTGKEMRIDWKEPYKFLMRPALVRFQKSGDAEKTRTEGISERPKSTALENRLKRPKNEKTGRQSSQPSSSAHAS